MGDIDHARMMLRLARKDLGALRGMLDPVAFDDAIFGFHAQQAVEKSLKSWLSVLAVAHPRTHNLRDLLAILEQHDATIPQSLRSLAVLTAFAVFMRYDVPDTDEDPLDRPALVRQVEALVQHVEQLVRDAKRP